MKKVLAIAAVVSLMGMPAAAQRKVEIVERNAMEQPAGKTLKRKVAIGRFSNETQYGKGVFYNKENDPIGKQALDILSAKLAASNQFILLERNDLSALLEECAKGGNAAQTIGADYMIIGSVTEFGRKNVGRDGIFTSTKQQVVEAKVSMRLVDVASGLIIYSDEAAGSAELTSRSTFGIGGKAGFDATLSDKAISEAIGQLVENIINKCTGKPWRTYLISHDSDGTIIAGGASQGIAEGDTFAIMTKGKTVKNPQTGVNIELPGKQVGTVTVLSSAGETPETEYSIVEVSDPQAIGEDLTKYVIQEIK